jgi:two-component system, chemotaxis family, CheB/CheR fusion protein
MQGLSLPDPCVSPWPTILFSTSGGGNPVKDIYPSGGGAEKEKRQLRILVVDDAPDVLEMFDMMLRLSGYEVEASASAIEALEKASGAQFDVIVSDIGMPYMNGYELARRLRALPGYASVPMIAVTGFARYNDREQALESGFNAHLSKPVNPITLLDLIEQFRE